MLDAKLQRMGGIPIQMCKQKQKAGRSEQQREGYVCVGRR